MSAAPIRRAALFCALAEVNSGPDRLAEQLRAQPPNPQQLGIDPLTSIAQSLMTLRARDVIVALYSTAPEGVLGILRRMGLIEQPFSHPVLYDRLFRILLDPAAGFRADALRRLEKIGAGHVRTAAVLDRVLVSPEMLRIVSGIEEAHTLNATLALIRRLCPTAATDEAIRASIRAMTPTTRLSAWVSRWIARAERLPHDRAPIEDHDFRILASAQEVRETAARFKNCLRTLLPEIALGRKLFLEYRPAAALVELVPLSDGHWLSEGVYIASNKSVSPELRQEIRDKLTASGILIYARHVRGGASQHRVAKLVGIYDYGYGLGGDEDVLADLETA